MLTVIFEGEERTVRASSTAVPANLAGIVDKSLARLVLSEFDEQPKS